ncbi:MAG: competence/damage-inducible protein A [Bdellovibrionia bacterium]
MENTRSIEGKASILAIGTELTTGQITNRNAAWIAEKLINLGIEVVLHETVPDDHQLIREALDHCKGYSQFIFVTGGLGPTTDDFTRNVIADWLNQPLEFHEDIWMGIKSRLGDLGITVAESNRQQCFFPNKAEIIPNPEGTAAGFTAAIHSTPQRIWVFPGPPREVSSVWDQGVEMHLREIVPAAKPLKLFTWQCMGKTEAEFGEITETVLAGSHLKTGYRAHRPFVEIKVWCTEQELQDKGPWIQKLEETLSPWIITKQGEDLAVKLLEKLQRNDEIEIIDAASGGLLTDRIGKLLRLPKYQAQSENITVITEWAAPAHLLGWMEEVLEQADPESVTLVLGGIINGVAALGLREGTRVHHEQIMTPYPRAELIDRAQHFIVEMALKKWGGWLDSSTN